MSHGSRIGNFLTRLLSKSLAVPLIIKILGIVGLVAVLFGGIILVQTQKTTYDIAYRLLERKTLSAAQLLIGGLARPLSTGDLFETQQVLERVRKAHPDIRYLIVRDEHQKIFAHSFENAVPTDLVAPPRHVLTAKRPLRVLNSQEGVIFEAYLPILKGHGGFLQLGLLDHLVFQQLSGISRSMLWGLGISVVVGMSLAVVLSHVVIDPIRRVEQSVKRIGKGDFATRSEVSSLDEFGRLAATFNEMAASLEQYRKQVEEKERARGVLIEKIVTAQEEERKVISRELHDQLGQSLLAINLGIQSGCEECRSACTIREETGTKLREAVEQIHRLAWGMRPAILDDYGLDSALASHVKEMSKHVKTDIDYQYSCLPGLGRLPDYVEVTLYRVAQEALTNIVRHAEAKKASLVVLQRREEVTLLVEDDGMGFDSAAVERGTRLGLSSMKERVALLDGVCDIESVLGGGTTLRVKIPL